MSARSSCRARAGVLAAAASTPLRLSSTSRSAPVASTAWPICAASVSRLYGARPCGRRRAGEASTKRQSPAASHGGDVAAEGAQVGAQVVGGLLERDEDAGLPAAHALGEELAGEHRLGAARLTGDDRGPPRAEAAHGHLVEAGDAGRDLADGRALLAAVAPEVQQALPPGAAGPPPACSRRPPAVASGGRGASPARTRSGAVRTARSAARHPEPRGLAAARGGSRGPTPPRAPDTGRAPSRPRAPRRAAAAAGRGRGRGR